MKNLVKVIAVSFAALISISTTVNAQVGVTRTGNVSVESVSVGGSGDAFIRTGGSFVDRCGSTNGSLYLLPNTHNASNSLLAILLTAQASGSEIDITIASACLNVGAASFNQVVNIAIVGS